MAKIMEVPEGTDKVNVRTRINKMLSNARKMQSRQSVYFVGKR